MNNFEVNNLHNEHTKKELKNFFDLGKRVEEKSLYEEGLSQGSDGSPYSADVTDKETMQLVTEALKYEQFYKAKIKAVQEKNPKANPACSNWILWSILDEIGVARYKLGHLKN